MKIKWLDSALHNLRMIVGYIANDNPSAARKLAEKIRLSVRQLSRHPEMGYQGRKAETRELVIAGTSYLVIYRINIDQIEILHILHGAQRWPHQ